MLQAEEAAGRVGGTSVVTDDRGRALYFSKRLIPHLPKGALDDLLSPVRLHVGVYAYRPDALELYERTAPAQLELLEGLEQLRFLTRASRSTSSKSKLRPSPCANSTIPRIVEPIEQALIEAGLE